MAIERTRNVKRTSKGIWSGVRRWRGDVRKQYESSVTCYNFTRAIAAPSISTAEWYCLCIASKVVVPAENGVATGAIGNYNAIGFVIARRCTQPDLGLPQIMGSSRLGVSSRSWHLQ